MADLAQQSRSAETPEKILDAAESLFVEYGFAATSLRAIANEAGVNLAATNYHFGSKIGLFAAVFHRRVDPINEARLAGLRALQESEQSLTVRQVLEVFFRPLEEGIHDPTVPALIGRMMTEPQSLKASLLENEFQEVAHAYLAALLPLIPDTSAEELRWRFHFMIGSMIHLLQLNAPLGTEPTLAQFSDGLPRLMDFVEAGLLQTGDVTQEQGKSDA